MDHDSLKISIQRAREFAMELQELAEIDKLSLLEMSLALQCLEIMSKEKHGSAWSVAWDFSARIWAQAKRLKD